MAANTWFTILQVLDKCHTTRSLPRWYHGEYAIAGLVWRCLHQRNERVTWYCRLVIGSAYHGISVNGVNAC